MRKMWVNSITRTMCRYYTIIKFMTFLAKAIASPSEPIWLTLRIAPSQGLNWDKEFNLSILVTKKSSPAIIVFENLALSSENDLTSFSWNGSST